jgi:general secretion pathway protein G
MTQQPEDTRATDGKRQLVRQIIRWFCVVAVVICLVLLWAARVVRREIEGQHQQGIYQAKIFVRAVLKTPLGAYRIQTGSYPSTAEGLQALLKAPPGKETLWQGPYLELTPPDKMPPDPWGHAYRYRQPGTHNPDGYDVFSAGPDGIPDTDDDIGNW